MVFEETGAWLEYELRPGAKGIVVICPGGGYEYVSPRESNPVARRFVEAGWQPVILKYSVGRDLGRKPLREAAWAVRTARSIFAEAGSPFPFVGICGFSAGGHLAASLGVHWDDGSEFPSTETRRMQRPDALILSYPVITGGPHRHRGSFENLGAGEENTRYFSLEKHVTPSTPPSFLWHTAEDESVPVENTLLFAEALLASRVPVEMHIYPFGPHGMSLATPEVEDVVKGRRPDPHIAGWFDLCVAWLDVILARQMKRGRNDQ